MLTEKKGICYIEHIETINTIDPNNTKRNFYWFRFVSNNNTDGLAEERQSCFILTKSDGFIYDSGDWPPSWFDFDSPKLDKVFRSLVHGKLKKHIII